MKAYIVQYTDRDDGILGVYLSRDEAEASQNKYEFETYIEEHDIGTEKVERKDHGENVFERKETKKMTPRELFEIIEDLCKVHGVEKVKTTIISFFEILEKGRK